MIPNECCSVCECFTERAGRADDSLYLETPRGEVGPLCEDCHDALRQDVLRDTVNDLLKALKMVRVYLQYHATPSEERTGIDIALFIEIHKAEGTMLPEPPPTDSNDGNDLLTACKADLDGDDIDFLTRVGRNVYGRDGTQYTEAIERLSQQIKARRAAIAKAEPAGDTTQ